MKMKGFYKWYKKTYEDKNKWDFYSKEKEVKKVEVKKPIKKNWQDKYDNY